MVDKKKRYNLRYARMLKSSYAYSNQGSPLCTRCELTELATWQENEIYYLRLRKEGDSTTLSGRISLISFSSFLD